MISHRWADRFLPLVLCAAVAAPPRAAAQWTLIAELASARFSGGAGEERGGRSLRPYRPTIVGVGVERAAGPVGVAIRGYYARASLALEGADAVVAVKDAMHLRGVALDLSEERLATLGSSARLMGYVSPMVERWTLADQASHVGLGFCAGLALEVPLGGHWSAAVRGGAAVSGSPFAADDLDAGYVPRTLWRREVSGRLRYRL